MYAYISMRFCSWKYLQCNYLLQCSECTYCCDMLYKYALFASMHYLRLCYAIPVVHFQYVFLCESSLCSHNCKLQGMTLATGPLARRRFSAAGPVGPQACIFYWPDGPLGNRSGHRWVWRTLARRRWWLCLQSPRKQQTVTSVLMGICHHGVAVRGFVWLCL